MKEKAIIFGASKLGEMSYIFYRDEYDIICFCDNDVYKVGKSIFDKRIISPILLNQYDNIKIIIASQYYTDIANQLVLMGITNFQKSIVTIQKNYKDSIEKHNIRSINLGEFLEKVGPIKISNSIFINEIGCDFMNSVFLKALAIKFNLSTYLEIGTFIGESIDAVSDVIKKCYTISMPNDNLNILLKKMDKNNFRRYFSCDKENVAHYEEDFETFDLSEINDNIDLIYINGNCEYKKTYLHTKKIFSVIDINNTIVVWNDMETNGENKFDTINAIFNAVSSKFHSMIYLVGYNNCIVYVPDKYIEEFDFKKNPCIFYSYSTILHTNRNCITAKPVTSK